MESVVNELEQFIKNESVPVKKSDIVEHKAAAVSLATVSESLKAFKPEADKAVSTLQSFKAIETEEQAMEAGAMLKAARATLKAIEDKRMESTRPLDEAKKMLMAVQKEIITPIESAIDTVSKKVNQYNAIQEQKRIAEQQRIEKEKAVRVEVEMARATTEAKLQKLVKDTLSRLQATMLDELNKTTDLDGVKVIESRLGQWKPKLATSTYDSCFTHNFTKEAAELWKNVGLELSIQYDYPKLAKQYEEDAANAIIFFKTANIPERKTYLIELATKSAQQQHEQRERDEANRKARQEAEAKAKTEQESRAKADAELKARTEAEAAFQTQQQALGATKKVKYVAVIESGSAGIEILKTAMASGYNNKGLNDQIQSAANYLANGNRPRINGVRYELE